VPDAMTRAMSDIVIQKKIITCDVCSQPYEVSDGMTTSYVCERCGKVHRLHPKSAHRTLAFSLTALIFYFPANLFPFMTMELYGNRTSSTIWGGVVSLTKAGSVFLAIIVFLASILIPLIKLIVLFYLSATARSAHHQRFKTKLYHIIEAIGRWSMLDIFLLAVLVAVVKLSHWTTVEPEIGSVLFASVVIFTLLASANFDPKLIWEDLDEKHD
jgi:paraquat-inducible protein A